MAGAADPEIPQGALGVFDSGVGGLTVVGALLRQFPHERVLYVADQAHVPYGGRPLDEVCGFAQGISRFLADSGCRAVVMACNISSATALPSVMGALAPIPALGVISPAAAKAAAVARAAGGAPVGVLATEGTVRSGAYPKFIQCNDPLTRVAQVGCPRFVPLVEAGRTDSAEADDACREYLRPLAQAGCRTIVLGCTHYPFLLPALQRAARDLFDGPVAFIDPAGEMAASLRVALPDVGVPREAAGRNLLLTTGDADTFRQQAPRFLPDVDFEISRAGWQEETLRY